MSYYLIGPVAFVHILLLAYALLTGHDISSYLLHVLPLLTMIVIIRKVMGAMWEQDPNTGWQLTGTALALSTWPVYVLSLGAAFLRIPLPHLATPKRAAGGNYVALVIPQIVAVSVLLFGLGRAFERGLSSHDLLTVVFATAVIVVHSVVLWGVWEGWTLAQKLERPPARPAPALETFTAVSAPEPEPLRDV